MDNPPSRGWEKRNRLLNFCYYTCLFTLGAVVLYHWIFGGEFGLFGKFAAYAVCALIVIGFLNASIGLMLSRIENKIDDALKRIEEIEKKLKL